MNGSKYLVALDLRSEYWQIPMEQESRQYTTFRAGKGLRVCGNALRAQTAPATFQRNLDFLLGCLVYIDDILVHAKDFTEALRRLRIVFRKIALRE